MRLIVDTNILVRCVRGKAFWRVVELRKRNVGLIVTQHNVEELIDVLIEKSGFEEDEALRACARVLHPFDVIEVDSYRDCRTAAARRLHEGGQSDWPVLAGAIALDCAIWSEDTDFFGTGVAVWNSLNVLDCASPTGKQTNA